VSITVCTARLSYGGPGRLDITRSNALEHRNAGEVANGEVFAPDVDLFRAVRTGRMVVDLYLERYREQLERANHSIVKACLEGLYGDPLVGVCFCAPRVRVLTCHRTVWREFMVSQGAIDGRELPEEEQGPVRRVKPSRQGRLF